MAAASEGLAEAVDHLQGNENLLNPGGRGGQPDRE